MGGFLQALGSLGGDIGGALGTLGEDTGSALGSVWNELGTGVSSLKWPSASGGGVGYNLGTLLDVGLLGGGLIGNYQQQQKINALNSLLSNPAALAHYIQSMSHPLAAGAVASARNAAQASLGERGLSQSPAQSAAVYAQALAPLYAAQQDEATQAAMSALGAREQLLSSQRPSSLAGVLQDLMRRAGGGGTTDPTDPAPWPNFPTGVPGQPTYPGSQPPWSGLPSPTTGIPPGGIGPMPNLGNVPLGGGTDPSVLGLPPWAMPQPDWAQILGGFSSSAPGFDFGSLPPAFNPGPVSSDIFGGG